MPALSLYTDIMILLHYEVKTIIVQEYQQGRIDVIREPRI